MYLISCFQLLSAFALSLSLIFGALGGGFLLKLEYQEINVLVSSAVVGMTFSTAARILLSNRAMWSAIFSNMSSFSYGLGLGFVAANYSLVGVYSVAGAMALILSCALFRLSISTWNRPYLITIHSLCWLAVMLKSWYQADEICYWIGWVCVVITLCYESWSRAGQFEREQPMEFGNRFFLSSLIPPQILKIGMKNNGQ